MNKRIHILGIGGTFMGGLAVIAKQMGFNVTGSDEKIYPPMLDRLKEAGIDWNEGYDAAFLKHQPDEVVIGNALSRGNPAVEAVLNQNIPYTSGAEWLARNILATKHVLAVAGTHGKTTTTSILTWILEYAGLKPSYLIGGAAKNFAATACLTDGDYFVIEADEYDTAFFDKSSKFLHYRPKTLIINNLEYDHADIFENLEAIKKQFQILLRTVPSEGCVIYPKGDVNLKSVLSHGIFSKTETLFGQDDWHYALHNDGSEFTITHKGKEFAVVQWSQFGEHNVKNAVAAAVAAIQIGIDADTIVKALAEFKGVKRRLDIFAKTKDLTFYDDFAHHPTAIASTLHALRKRVGNARVVAVAEFASNTMKQGGHKIAELVNGFNDADVVLLLNSKENKWTDAELKQAFKKPIEIYDNVDAILKQLKTTLKPQDHIVLMSNRSFGGIYQKIRQEWEA